MSCRCPLFFMLKAYELGGSEEYLSHAQFFGDIVYSLFYDDSSALPKVTSQHDFCEALTGGDDLSMALYDFHVQWGQARPGKIAAPPCNPQACRVSFWFILRGFCRDQQHDFLLGAIAMDNPAYERFGQDEEQLHALLEGSEVPVVVAVTVPDAPSCRTAQDVLQQASKNIEGRARIVHVDAEQCSALLRQHQVETVPALLALDSGGLVAQHVGMLEPGDVIHVLGLDIWREADAGAGRIDEIR